MKYVRLRYRKIGFSLLSRCSLFLHICVILIKHRLWEALTKIFISQYVDLYLLCDLFKNNMKLLDGAKVSRVVHPSF